MAAFVVDSTNTRDLGGHATADGATIRPRRLFRSGRLTELRPSEVALIEELELKTVLDLRRPSEVAANPPPAPFVDRVRNISTSRDDNEFSVVANRLASDDPMSNPEARARAYFVSVVTENLPRYKPVFELVVDPSSHPLLFHCTAGKDRAGFVAAAILGMLGVDDDAILADYELTNESRPGFIEARRAEISKGDPSLVQARLRMLDTLLLAQRPFMQALLDAVRERFDGWDGLRRDGLGIGDDRFAEFRDSIVDPPPRSTTITN